MAARLAAALAILLGLAQAAWAERPRDELVIGISQFPGNFNPNINTMASKNYILNMAHRPVTAYDAAWRQFCVLCTELPTLENGRAVYETTDDGKPGIAVTYTLKPDLRWGDGTPVTTRDVLFTWEVGRHPQSGVAGAEGFRRIVRIDARDERTYTVHVDKRSCDFAGAGGFDLLPAHLDGPVFAADPVAYRNRSLFETDTTNPGLWFGPYRIVAVESGSHVVLERNPMWAGPQPHFRRIVVKTFENTASMMSNLLSGGIDYIAGEVGLTLDQALAFEERVGDRFRFLYKPVLSYEHVDVNLDNPILADRRVRRALAYGANREAISKRLFGGHQPVAASNVNPLDRNYDPDVPQYPYDPERARALLDEAGWRNVRNGIRHDAEGRPLRIELMTTAGNKTREMVEQVLQSDWRRIGVDLRIRNEPARVFFGSTMTKRTFTGLVMYAWMSAPGSLPRGQLHSQEIPSAENGWSGQNYPGYRNPEMDRLAEAVETVCEPVENQRLWSAVQRLYAEDLPVIPLYFRADPHIMPKWLDGVRPTGHLIPVTMWVEQWRPLP